jgi:malonyl-CoA O-methyltransferase
VTILAPAQGYALWAPTYAAETAVSALEASVVASLDVPLRGKRVLDVGCGIARRLGAAREAGASVALGIDLTPAMLAQARDEPLLAAADARALPVADAAFDVVWCRLVLGHLRALEPAYRELARVCAPGGVVLVTDFHPAAATAGHRRTFRDAGGELHELENHVHRVLAHRVAAVRAGLSPRERRDGTVDDSVRGFYERAGRLDTFERQRGLPLVLALVFARAK